MRFPTFLKTALALAASLGAGLGAQAAGHYVPGVEGVQAASVPPPGVYYLGYLADYKADNVRAPGTKENLPGDNSIHVTALANRLVWITDHKILGADYGVETIVPVQRTQLDLGVVPLHDNDTDLGDIYLGPVVLGWHGANWDAVAAAGYWLDSGSTNSPASPGKGYGSTMLTAGGTYYFDAGKTWTGSVLARYEFNRTTSSGFKPGQTLSVEWGLGKALGPVVVGLVGYTQQQMSKDSGPGALDQKASRSAAGAELIYPMLSQGLFLKGAFYQEFASQAATSVEPKGHLLRFTLVKAF